MKLLVSCCNENGGLFTIDINTEQVSRLTPKHYTSGRTGLTRNETTIYSAGPSDIYSYKWENNALTPLDHWSGFTDWDIHDIKYYDDHLYIVQTGGNCIAKIPASGEQTLEIVWQVDKRNDEDHIHLNSLQIAEWGPTQTILIASRFTEDKNGRPWREVTEEGRILYHDLSGRWVAKDYTTSPADCRLSHPHSLVWDPTYDEERKLGAGKERLIYIDSRTKALKRNMNRGMICGDDIENVVEGYPRGLLATEDFYYVGNSKTTNHEGINFKLDKLGIVEISKETLQKTREFIITDAIEIYDIIQLED